MEGVDTLKFPVSPDQLTNLQSRTITLTTNTLKSNWDAYWEDGAKLAPVSDSLVNLVLVGGIFTGGAVAAAAGIAAGAEAVRSPDVLRFYFDPSRFLSFLPVVGDLLGAIPTTFPVYLEAGNSDFVTGTSGNDWLRGGSANDTLIGGAGNDKLEGGEREDSLSGGAGDDLITGGGDQKNADEVYTDGSSTWSSVIQSRNVLTWDGDTLDGGAGSDVLRGDYGSDLLYGGTGRDVLWGGMGNDTLFGDAGNDYLIDGGDVRDNDFQWLSLDDLKTPEQFANPIDFVIGKIKDFVVEQVLTKVIGTPDDDWLYGGDGRDTLEASGGSNTLLGGYGDDQIQGGEDSDTIHGDGLMRISLIQSGLTIVEMSGTGIGNDTIDGGYGQDFIYGDDGNDVLTDPGSNGATLGFALLNGVRDLFGASPKVAKTDYLYGGEGNDTLGSATRDDPIELDGGPGDDVLISGNGRDKMIGGAGNDSYRGVDSQDELVELPDGGFDEIYTYASITLPLNFERVVTSVEADPDQVGGFAFRTTAITVTGNAQDNRFIAGFSGDVFIGGAGNDIYVGSENIVEEANGGFDTLVLRSGGRLRANVEAMELERGNADGSEESNSLRVTAPYYSGRIQGFGGNDTIEAANTAFSALNGDGRGNMSGLLGQLARFGNANATLDGGAGNDSITANDQDTTLIGGAGDDILNGGRGRDLLQGGAGNDLYRVSLGDTISGETDGYDVMESADDAVMFSGIEELRLTGDAHASGTGTTGNDRISGNNGANLIQGLGGNDTLVGGLGRDTLDGGQGDDLLRDDATALPAQEAGYRSGLRASLLSGNTQLVVDNRIYDTLVVDAVANGPRSLFDVADGGRYVFLTSSNALLDEGRGNTPTVFRLDLLTRDVDTTAKRMPAFTSAYDPSASADGNIVAYTFVQGGVQKIGLSWFSAFSGIDTATDAPATSRDSAGFEIASNWFGGEAADGNSRNAVVSADGAWLAFETQASNLTRTPQGELLSLIPTDTNGTWDIYLRSTGPAGTVDYFTGPGGYSVAYGNMTRVSVGLQGAQSNGASTNADLSANGRFVAFLSEATNLVGNDQNGQRDAFVRDAELGTTELITRGANAATSQVAISDDGQIVAFVTRATNIAATIRTVEPRLLNGLNGGVTYWEVGSTPSAGIGDGKAHIYITHRGTGETVLLTDTANAPVTAIETAGLDLYNENGRVWLSFGGEPTQFNDVAQRARTVDDLFRRDSSDLMLGGTGNDTLDGGLGDDTLDGGEGADSLSGGVGRDLYVIDNAGDRVAADTTEGNRLDISLNYRAADYAAWFDTVRLLEGGTALTAEGGDRNETLEGNSLGNTLSGGAGDDSLIGRAGADSLDGGSGNDTLDGGLGADQLSGGAGVDTFILDDQGDRISDDAGEKTIILASTPVSTAQLPTGARPQYEVRLTGEAALSADLSGVPATTAVFLYGNAGKNLLTGGAGLDLLDGGAGDDTLVGGAGNDSFTGGEGIDTVAYSLAWSSVELAGSILRLPGGEQDRLSSDVERLSFNGLVGTVAQARRVAAESLTLKQGGVTINPRTIDTLPGNVLVREAATAGEVIATLEVVDANSVFGDTQSFSWRDGDVKPGGAAIANSFFAFTGNSITLRAGVDAATLPRSFEAVLRSVGQDGLSIGRSFVFQRSVEPLLRDGTTGADSLRGGSGDDTLNGGEGNDTLDGLAGDDLLRGQGGADTLNGGDDEDTLQGGAGNDLLVGGAGDDVLDGGDDADSLQGGDGQDSLTGGQGSDTLEGGAGDDTLDGGVGADSLVGGAGNDLYRLDDPADVVVEAANGGNDTIEAAFVPSLLNIEMFRLTGVLPLAITGGAGNETLQGNDANNAISGLGGDDLLLGGGGDDTLTGGTGRDTLDGGAGGADLAVFGTAWSQVSLAGLGGGYWLRDASNGTGAAVDGLTGLWHDRLQGIEFVSFGGRTGRIGDAVAVAATSLTLDDPSPGDNGGITQLVSAAPGAVLGRLTAVDANATFGDVQSFAFADATGGMTAAQADAAFQIVGAEVRLRDAAALPSRTPGDVLTLAISTTGLDGLTLTRSFAVTLTTLDVALRGTEGPDTLTGGVGNDGIAGLGGADQLSGAAGDDTLLGGAGNDVLSGGEGNDLLRGEAGDDVLQGGPGADTLEGGLGLDRAVYDGAWSPTRVTRSGTDFLIDGDVLRDVEQITLGATTGALADAVAAAPTAVLLGPARADGSVLGVLSTTAPGGTSLGVLSVIDPNRLFGETYTYQIIGQVGRFNAASVFEVVAGELRVIDTYLQQGVLSGSIRGPVGFTLRATGQDGLSFDQRVGIDVIGLSQTITGNNTAETLEGGVGNDTILGNGGDDWLYGGGGQDSLVGGAGNDFMNGGPGADTILFEDIGDEVSYDPFDLIVTSLSGIDLTAQISQFTIDFETFVLFGTALGPRIKLVGDGTMSITGTSVRADRIIGNDGETLIHLDNDDPVFGKADTAEGGTGNDTYWVDGDETIIELPGGGFDRVFSNGTRGTFVLPEEVETLTLTGTGNANAGGNAAANTIEGNAGDNRLLGGGGNDTILGGAGDDTLQGDSGDDSLQGGDGTDTGAFGAAWTDATVSLIGEGRYRVTGPEGSDTLEGVERLSFITGAGAIADAVATAASLIALTPALLPFDALAGSELGLVTVTDRNADFGDVNTISFLDAPDGFSAARAAAVFTLVREAGGTRILVAADEALAEFAGRSLGLHLAATGLDGLVADATFMLSVGPGGVLLQGTAAGETLTGGNGNDTLLGQGGDDLLVGGRRSDLLDGGTGNDTLRGGSEDDTYIVDSALDVVEEAANGGGRDKVQSSAAAYTLAANVEVLELLLGAISGTGNAANNLIIGNAGDNTLDGGGGNDTLRGGAGNDTYLVTWAASGPGSALRVEEAADGGIDEVRTNAISLLFDNVENLTLVGTTEFGSSFGTGNALANRITGTDGDNLLRGGDGDDTLIGQGGQDNLEGEAGDDLLIGGPGSDVLLGGEGNDTYEGVEAGDTVIDTGGIDLIRSAVSFVLDNAAIENLELTGSADIDGTGHAGDNRITGNAGANLLQGGGGADTLAGGEGDDTLDGGAGNDSLVGGGGTDLALYDAAWLDLRVEAVAGGYRVTDLRGGAPLGVDLLSGVENITIGGVASAIGNAVAMAATVVALAPPAGEREGGASQTLPVGLATGAVLGKLIASDANGIFGDSQSYALADVAGDGIDATLLFQLDGDNLVVRDGTALAALAGRTVSLELRATGRDGLTGSSPVSLVLNQAPQLLTGGAGNDSLTGGLGNDTLRGLGGDDALNGGGGANTLEGGAGNDAYLAGGLDTIIEEVGGGHDTVLATQDLTLAENVEDLLLFEAVALRGTGNGLANLIIGNAGANRLAGGGGNDTLRGEQGADTLLGEAGDDQLIGGPGNDSLVGGDGVDTAVYSLPWNQLTLRAGNGGSVVVTGAGEGEDTLSGVEFITADGLTGALADALPQVASLITVTDPTPGPGGALTLSARATSGAMVATLAALDANSIFGDAQSFSLADAADGLPAARASAYFAIEGTTLRVAYGAVLPASTDLRIAITATGLDGLTASRMVTVSVDAGNIATPVAVDDAGGGYEDDVSLTDVIANDTDEDVGDVLRVATGVDAPRVTGIRFGLDGPVIDAATGAITINGIDTTGAALLAALQTQVSIVDGTSIRFAPGGPLDAMLNDATALFGDVPRGPDFAVLTIAYKVVDAVGHVSAAPAVLELGITGQNETIIGTPAAELLTGLAGDSADNIVTNGGADTLQGLGGDDALIVATALGTDAGTAGATLQGGAGNDYLNGGRGADLLEGGDGNDELHGDFRRGRNGDGDDTLLGGAGNDLLYGGAGADTFVGGPGDDTIFDDSGSNDGAADVAVYAADWVNYSVTIYDSGSGYVVTDKRPAGTPGQEGQDILVGPIELVRFGTRTGAFDKAVAVAASSVTVTPLGGAGAGAPAGTLVARLAAEDANAVFGDVQRFSFADAAGGLSASQAGALLTIDGGTIRVATGAVLTQGDLRVAIKATGLDGLSTTQAATLTIGAPNAATPVAVADAGSGSEDDALLVNLVANDTDGDTGDRLSIAGGVDAPRITGIRFGRSAPLIDATTGGVTINGVATTGADLLAALQAALSVVDDTSLRLAAGGPLDAMLNDAQPLGSQPAHGPSAAILTVTYRVVDAVGHVSAQPGLVELTVNGRNEAITGTVADETLRGLAGDSADAISTGGGADTVLGGGGDDLLTAATAQGGDAGTVAVTLRGEAGDDVLLGGRGADLLDGGLGNDELRGDGRRPGDALPAGGDDTLVGGLGNDTIDGGPGNDIARLSGAQGDYRIAVRDGVVMTSGADGVDQFLNVELFQWGDAALVSLASLAAAPGNFGLVYSKRGDAAASYELPTPYSGSAAGIVNEFMGGGDSDIILGTGLSDFFNAGAGDDAIDGGAGNDVIDGGLGSNFLTGGSGSDTFFVDGRNAAGISTWSTITDFGPGEAVTIWGYRPGISQYIWVANDGAPGYQGATLHWDLDSNGLVETSVTFSGLTQAQLPALRYGTVEGQDYIFIG